MSYEQGSGANAQLVIDFEQSYKKAPAEAKGKVMPFNSMSFVPDQKANAPATILSGRDPLEPLRGFINVSGDISAPLDGKAFGYWLRAVFGAVASAAVTAVNLDHSAVTDLDNGVVGLPAAGHGMYPGQHVLVSGTTNYDGEYVLGDATTADLLAVVATYAAETLAAGTVTLCGRELHSGDAVDLGSGLVGVPLADHGLAAGDKVTISGSTNYNNTYTLADATSEDQLVISNAYVAETFATASVVPVLYRHSFTLGSNPPSLVLEKQFTDMGLYERGDGAKVSKMDIKVGGDNELVATLSVVGAKLAPASEPYDGAAVEAPFARFLFDQEFLRLAGATSDVMLDFDMTVDNALDADNYPIGCKGYRASLPVGKGSVGGSAKAMFVDQSLLTLGENFTATDVTVGWVRPLESLAFIYPKVKIARTGVPVTSPKGLTLDLTWQAYREAGSAVRAVTAVLVNQIENYTS